MIADRVRSLVVLVGLIIVSACSTERPDVTVTRRQRQRPVATATADRRPLLIDTDVAPDDLVAIAFLLASPKVEIEAITVSGTGEAHCDAGVDVVLRLLERLDAPGDRRRLRTRDADGRRPCLSGCLASERGWRVRARPARNDRASRSPVTRCSSSRRPPPRWTGCAS